MSTEQETEPRHCDEYINDFDAPMCLRWFLFVNRLPASDKHLCERNGVKPRLFATHFGKKVRIVMASRLGDVGITEKLDAENGYSTRVAVADLTDFTDQRFTGKR